ncbi:hypothetical protein [Nonomuraea salmonea]|uniref:hypothetical protein n=1 Tax=Nonomuraea salmonea TaxID=46181 RepID=UPI002FEA15F2
MPETLPGALAVERFFLPISNGTEVAGLAVVREEGRVYARVVAMGRVTDAYELSTFAQVDVTDVAEQERAALLAEIDRLKGRIDAMEDDCTLLSALQAAGVDNWDGYGYAHELMREWDQGGTAGDRLVRRSAGAGGGSRRRAPAGRYPAVAHRRGAGRTDRGQGGAHVCVARGR